MVVKEGDNTTDQDVEGSGEDKENGTDTDGPYFTVVVENRRNILISNLGHYEDYDIQVSEGYYTV